MPVHATCCDQSLGVIRNCDPYGVWRLTGSKIDEKTAKITLALSMHHQNFQVSGEGISFTLGAFFPPSNYFDLYRLSVHLLGRMSIEYYWF